MTDVFKQKKRVLIHKLATLYEDNNYISNSKIK